MLKYDATGPLGVSKMSNVAPFEISLDTPALKHGFPTFSGCDPPNNHIFSVEGRKKKEGAKSEPPVGPGSTKYTGFTPGVSKLFSKGATLENIETPKGRST